MEGMNDLSTIERLKILKSIRVGCSSDLDFDSYLEQHSGELNRPWAVSLLHLSSLPVDRLRNAYFPLAKTNQASGVAQISKVERSIWHI